MALTSRSFREFYNNPTWFFMLLFVTLNGQFTSWLIMEPSKGGTTDPNDPEFVNTLTYWQMAPNLGTMDL